MDNKILVFFPNSLDTRKSGYIKGFHKYFLDCEAYYITSNQVFPNAISEFVGYIGQKTKSQNFSKNLLIFNNVNNTMSITNRDINFNCLVQVTYDYDGFKNSDMIDFESNYGTHFQLLSSILRKTNGNDVQNNAKNRFWQLTQAITVGFLNIILWVIIH